MAPGHRRRGYRLEQVSETRVELPNPFVLALGVGIVALGADRNFLAPAVALERRRA